MILLGVAADDTDEDIEYVVKRVVRLRLFDGPDGRISRDLAEAGGGLLVVSQFTLFASTRKGTKPSWHRAAPPEVAEGLYDRFTAALGLAAGRPVVEGRFGAAMEIDLCNDGPVTLWLDSRTKE